MKKTIAIVLLVLVILGVGGYFILPSTINWEKYTQELSAAVKAATGRNLVIQGEPSFSLRPVPILKLGKITLTSAPGGAYPNMLVAPGAEILFDAGALFKRQTKIKKITLHSPQFFIEDMPDGRLNWQFDFLRRQAAGAAVGFESLLINNGTAEVRGDKYSAPYKWRSLNAELFADSLQGPFFFEGNVAVLSTTFGFSVKIERLTGSRPPEFTLRVTNAPSETSVSFSGGYGAKGGDNTILEGNVTFEMRKTGEAFKILFPGAALPDELFQPLVGNFSLRDKASSRLVEMNDVLFKFGASSATGKMSVQKISPETIAAEEEMKLKAEFAGEEDIVLRDPNNPDEAVSLTDVSVDVSDIAENTLPKIVTGAFIFSKFEADPWFSHIGAIAEFIAKTGNFSKTKDKYDFNFSFDTMDYRRDVIRQAKLAVANEKGALKFSSVSAQLPGNGRLQGDAALHVEKKNPVFSGNVSFEADNAAAFMRWIGIAVPEEVPANLLRNFVGNTTFKMAKNGLILEKTSLTLDQMTASGGLSMRYGTRPAVALVLKTNALNFDAYFPETAKKLATEREEALKTDTPFGEKLKLLFGRLAFLNDFDATLKLNSDTLEWAGLKAEKAVADLSLIRGFLQVKGVSVQEIMKASIDMKGEMSGFGGGPSFDNFEVRLNTKQLGNVLKFANISLTKELTRSDLLYMTGRISGGLDAFDMKLDADFGHVSFTAAGNMHRGASLYDFDLMTTIEQDNFRNFARLFTDKYRPVLANPGEFKFKGRLIRDERMLQGMDLDFSVGANRFTGNFKLDFLAERPTLAADLTADTLAPLGMIPKMNILDPAVVNAAQNPLPPAPAKDSGAPFFTAFSEKVALPKVPLDLSFLGNYSADVALKSRSLTLDKLSLSDFDGNIRLAPDGISLDLRRASWKGANVVSLSHLRLEKNVPQLQVRLRMANIPSAARAFGNPALDFSFGGMTFDFNLQSAGATASALADAAKGKGNISLTNVALNGVDYVAAQAALLPLPKADKTAFMTASASGTTALEEVSAPFILDEGAIVFSPVKLVYGGKQTDKSRFSYNFITKEVKASLDINLSGGSMPDYLSTGLPSFVKEVSGVVGKTEVSSNAEALVNTADRLKEGEASKKRQELDREQKAVAERIAAEQKQRLDELTDLERRLLLQSEDLKKKVDGLTEYAGKVYQVQTYYVLMQRDLATMNTLLAELRALMKSDHVTEAAVKEQQEKIKKAVFDKEAEIEKNHSVALTVGTKGLIVDMVRQANDSLMQTAKMKASYKNLKGLSDAVDAIVADVEALKAIQKRSDGMEDTTQLILLVAEAEGVLEKINISFADADMIVKREEERIAAEEARKKAEEEAKRKAEEEAKKQAAAAAEAERQRKIAEEKERQRTIVRKDGVVSETPTRPSRREPSQPVFKLLPESGAAAPAASSAPAGDEPKGMIIRRR